ncbi:MAG TPA: hypothetical protein VFZ06_11910 [Acidimicrobiia bacterium]|nr:hypothetical protein [Acidimicrobiia bacterium]
MGSPSPHPPTSGVVVVATLVVVEAGRDVVGREVAGACVDVGSLPDVHAATMRVKVKK